MLVVATAGHVDAGKSTLVRALTGMEPDRFAEERRRGMTLDLGFAWTVLPTGETVAFVDVPGHERFVSTMLAGVGPVPAALIVVAADRGWQAQSEEHLAAMAALGVRHALLAVTRCDLADPGSAETAAADRLAAAGLGPVPTVRVSGRTGAGLDDLRLGLALLAADLPPADPDADVRLWVDRAFSIRGAGTVVTGTLPAGTVRVGTELEVGGTRRRVGVRGVQSLGLVVPLASGVARVALNLRGVAVEEMPRGTALLTPDRWLPVSLADVRLAGPVADLPLEPVLHVGSAAVTARLRPLGADTARLRLDRPLPLRIGDRALLRDPGRRLITGVTVLDVDPPGLRRRGSAAARAEVLAGLSGDPDGAGELRRRGLVTATRLRAMGVPPPAAPLVGDWLVDPDHAVALRARVGPLVTAYAREHPLEPTMPVDVLRRELDLPDPRLVPALLPADHRVAGGRVQAAAAAGGLPAVVQQALSAVRADLTASPFAAPSAERLAELGLRVRELAALTRGGSLLRVADGVYLLPGADAAAVNVLAGLAQPFTLSAARQALSTSRRVVVPLLELLGRQGRTRRRPDDTHEVVAPG